MKRIIFMYLTILVSGCTQINKEYVDYYPNGSIKTKGKIKNGLFDGRVERYFNNGKMLFIRNYKEGKLNGLEKVYSDINPSIELLVFYKNDEIITQKLYDTISGNIISTFNNGVAKIYGKPNQILIISNSKDTSHHKFIKFTNDGKLRAYQGPLDFLTKKDSSDLTNAYPNWKEMIKEWEHNQLKDKHEK